MRLVVALQDAANRDEVDKEVVVKVTERLWKALWTEDKNTSDESVMQSELDSLLPGGWEKWKHVSSHPTPYPVSSTPYLLLVTGAN